MPRYFFTTHDGEPFKDREGEDLPDEAAARREAVRLLGALLRDDPDDFLQTGRLQVVVSEATAGILFTVESGIPNGEPPRNVGAP